MIRRSIANIVVGTRHRRDMGAIAGLAASMAEFGLLHPIVIRPDGVLIAGERRLKAAKQLGWTDIPVTVVDLKAVARGEFAENIARKDFTLSEAVAIKRALEPLEKVAAKTGISEWDLPMRSSVDAYIDPETGELWISASDPERRSDDEIRIDADDVESFLLGLNDLWRKSRGRS
jgi:hypothetical protein